MELDEFIKNTLTAITTGISDANKSIFPDKDSQDSKLFMLEPGNDRNNGVGISFDVAITSQNDTSAKGGGKLKVAVFEADLSGGESSSNKNVSRVQFTVSVKRWHG